MANLPVSALIRQGGRFGTEDDDGMESGKRKSKDEYRKQKDLEEQRKAGTAPAMMDVETGRDINPHIPEFIEKTPWYIPHSGPTLKHQRPQPDRQKELSTLAEWYPKGTTDRVAFKYRDGACENCGAMGHKKKDCFDKPRTVGAKWTNSNIQPDDYQMPKLELGWDAKRDRWNGYNPSDYHFVEQEYEKMDETRKLIRAAELKEKEDEDAIREGEEEAEEKEKEKDEDDPDAKKLKSVAELDEDIYAEDATAPGQSVDMDSRTRITVRNLRIREDTAKYLYSLDPNGPYYDPKSRSMRENPFKNVPGKEDESAQFVSQNFALFTGEVVEANEAQVFAWQARCKGIDIHSLAEPTRLEALKREYEEQKEKRKSSVQNELLDKYGGAEHLSAPPKELLLAQTENYVEYNRKGKVIKGDERPAAKSKYEEDNYINNHLSVWGSYWRDGRWGFACCHQFIRNSYCLGEQGILVEKLEYGDIPMMKRPPGLGQIREKKKPIEEEQKKPTKTNGEESGAAPSTEMQEAMIRQMEKQKQQQEKKQQEEEEKEEGNDEVEDEDKQSKSRNKSDDDSANPSGAEDSPKEEEEAMNEEELRQYEEQLEKEKEKKMRDDKRRETRREKRRRQKERAKAREEKNDKNGKKRKAARSSSSSSSSSKNSSSDSESSSEDENLKLAAGSNKKFTKDLKEAIKKQMKQKAKGKELAEMGDRKRGYHRGLEQQEEQKPSDVDREAYNLTRIHSADPMAQFYEEKEQKRMAKKAKTEK